MRIFIDGSKRAAVSRMFVIWKNLGHEITEFPTNADVQLSVIDITCNSNLPIVLRLDGIYYDKGDNYKARNHTISIAHSKSNAVVYQSDFSKVMCEKYLAERKTNIYDIIYNGVNRVEWYNPKEHSGINIVSCAKWRRWKRLSEIIEIFNDFLKYYPDANLHIIGPIKRGTRLITHKKVIYYNTSQQIDFEKIKKIYQTMDMFIHIAKKDWCPSSVVEAIAAGLPVITTDACGGAVELCELTKGCVVVTGEDKSLEPDYSYQDDYNAISDLVKDSILKNMLLISNKKYKVQLPKELSIDYVAMKYLSIMKKII